MIKINFNNKHMTLLSSAFLNNLFPKPYEGELICGELRFTSIGDECNFYFSESYYEKLKNHIINEYNQGKFSRSNAESSWLNLMNKFNDYEDVNSYSEKVTNYWLSVNREKEIELNKNIENNFTQNFEQYESVVDDDGTTYKTIQIGSQIWLSENYKGTTNLHNNPIPIVENDSEWLRIEGEKICYWENNSENLNRGVIYNWEAINNLKCPKGWRVPTKNDWDNLINFLIDNRFNFDGSIDKPWGVNSNKIAKSLSSKNGWREYNSVGVPGNNPEKNNATKFDGQPFGFRFADGRFSNTPESASFWWTLTECDGSKEPLVGGDFAITSVLSFKYNSLDYSQQVKKFGCFLRLIKD